MHNNFYIVALGAAAGSLDALKQFFQAMPVEAPFAFVVISVDYSSQLLAQHLNRPVEELKAGMCLRPAQVYLLAQPMTMKAAKVYECPNASLIIDTFFHSLAQEQGALAIGIILSGNGNDGCQGIDHIKQHKGMVIIQTPSSARFNSMPQSALNTGQFDWVLLPAAMPTALMHVIYPDSERHYIAQLEQTLAATRQALQALKVVQSTEEHLCHAELALEERLQLVTSIGQIGICEWEIDSNDLFWDEMTFQLYGLDPAHCSLSYETWYNSLHPEDQQAVEAQLKSILASEQQCFELHFRIIRPDGNLRHIHARVQIRRDPKGQPLSLLGINWDVTEEIQARQALQDSEERFRLITETVQDVFWMSTPGVQKMLYVSPAYEQIWGYSCASLYQNPRSFFDAIHPEDKEQLIQGLTEHAHGKWMFEYRIITPQGEIRWIRDRSYPIVDATGELRLMTGTASDITAMKQTEQLLKNTQRLAHLGSWVLDVVTMETVWTEAVYRIYQLTPDIPIDLEMALSYYHPQEQARIRHAIDAAITEGRSWDMTCRFITAKGQLLWVRTRGEAVYLQDKVIQLQGYIQDITAYKNLELQLRHSHKELLRYFEQPLIGMVTANPDKTIINANQCFCDIVGYTLTELQTITWNALTLPEDLPSNINYYNQLLAGEIDMYQLEKRYIHKSGRIVPVQLAISCVRDEYGQVVYLIGFIQDISECRRIQLQLQETLARQQAIFANSGAGIAVVDQQRRFLELNQSWQKILGYSAADLIGQTTQVVHIDEEHYQRFGAQVVTQLPYEEISLEYPLKHKNGSIIWCQVSLNAVIHGDLSQGIIVLIVDISELYRARETAQAANQAKSQFLAHMSHELRTPLNAIMGYAQILATDATLATAVREKLMIIEHSGEHLLTLITDILDLSKIEAGHLDLVITNVRLQPLFDVIVHLFDLRTQQQGILFHYERDSTSAGLPTLIRADEKRLRQVLLNLLSNAIKFTSPGGFVSLRVAYSTDTMRIEVADNGRGIAASELEVIFQPFRQLGSQDQLEGTGLGLPICRQLVTLMGGTLHVSSTPGAGSIFSFELPLQVLQWDNPLSEPSVPLSRRAIKGYQGTRKKILVVDDIAANQTVLIDFLRPLDFEVLAASDCSQALQTINHWHPDIVFMDLRMPKIDGFDCTQRLRQQAHLQDTVIFALSASVLSEQKQQALSVGCNAFLDKPIDFETLLTALSHYCGIQWIEQDVNAVTADSLVSPPAPILAELLSLLRCGEIKSIKQLLERLEDEPLLPFREQALSLLNQFKLNELKELVTKVQKNTPEH